MLQRRRFIAALAVMAAPAQQAFTASLWSSIGSLFNLTLRHPFLTGLTSGTLPKEKFQFYLVQDSLYLGAFSRALSILASHAPRPEWASVLNRDAIETSEVESRMHSEILASYGVAAASIRSANMAPTTYAYTNHLLAACERHGFGPGLAAVLPCYWIYWEVGKALKKQGSPDKSYQRWIDQYAGEEYGNSVRRVLGIMDAEAAGLSSAQRDLARRNFSLSSRYEYMFWDMAWRLEKWPA